MADAVMGPGTGNEPTYDALLNALSPKGEEAEQASDHGADIEESPAEGETRAASRALSITALIGGTGLVVFGVLHDIGWHRTGLWFSSARNWALILLIAAFVLAIIGAWGVIGDVRHGIASTRQLGADLANAEQLLSEQHQSMNRGAPLAQAFYARFGQEQMDEIFRQVGPTARAQREALVAFTRRSNEVSDWKRWASVGLLLAGVALNFSANILSLYAS